MEQTTISLVVSNLKKLMSRILVIKESMGSLSQLDIAKVYEYDTQYVELSEELHESLLERIRELKYDKKVDEDLINKYLEVHSDFVLKSLDYEIESFNIHDNTAIIVDYSDRLIDMMLGFNGSRSTFFGLTRTTRDLYNSLNELYLTVEAILHIIDKYLYANEHKSETQYEINVLYQDLMEFNKDIVRLSQNFTDLIYPFTQEFDELLFLRFTDFNFNHNSLRRLVDGMKWLNSKIEEDRTIKNYEKLGDNVYLIFREARKPSNISMNDIFRKVIAKIDDHLIEFLEELKRG